MINFLTQVPSIYPSASRDFQYIGWLINIVLNSVKHNVNDLYDLPDSKADPRIAELLAMTLGFKIRRNYDHDQLAALTSIIPSILKYKGTKQALDLSVKALIKASGVVGDFDVDRNCTLEDNLLNITIPKGNIDITLLLDLLPYILPAGLTCRITRDTQLQQNLKDIEVDYEDSLYAEWHTDLAWDNTAKEGTGLASLFETGSAPIFTNFIEDTTDSQIDFNRKLNAGLLENTFIPALDLNADQNINITTSKAEEN